MSQYIYILLNPAHKSLLKIGRTSRTPDERAQELSKATGVPSPFFVAYESLVSDSNLAEKLIHQELSSQGYRLNPSREFFEVPLKVAVSVVDRICQSLPSGNDLLDDEAEFEENGSDRDYLALGLDHMTGTGTVLQDYIEARKCFEKAVALGNGSAYFYLAEINLWGLGVQRKSSEAFRVLQEGGKKGHLECYYKLWEIYSGTAFNSYSEEMESCIDMANFANADVAFRWYLDAIKNSNSSLEKEKMMAYFRWVLKVTPPGTRLIGTHTNAMLEALVKIVRQQMSQLKSARLAGMSIEKAVDKLTGKPWRLTTMMEFKELCEHHEQDPSPFLKAMLADFEFSDLKFGFSRLPSQSLDVRVAEYAPYLPSIPLRMPAAQALPNFAASVSKTSITNAHVSASIGQPAMWVEPVSKTSSTDTHTERKPTWWGRLFGK